MDTSSGNASAANLMSGANAFVNGSLITGTLATITLSDANTTMAAGAYVATDLTTVDPDLVSSKLSKGTSVFGVTGSSTVVNTSGANAIASQIQSGANAYVNGSLVTGTLPTQSILADSTSLSAGYVPATDLTSLDADLVNSNIASGVNIYGVVGTAVMTDTTSANAISHKSFRVPMPL